MEIDVLAEELIVALDPDQVANGNPLHRQIYEQVRRAILDARLRPGDRLPSSRNLAARLGVARNTVARAYEDLLAEGYLSGRVGSGTYVAADLGKSSPSSAEGRGESSTPRPIRSLSAWGQRLASAVPERRPGGELPYDFRYGTPDWHAFPRGLWLQVLGRAVRREAEELARYGDPAGYYPLRQAIARHLGLSRAITASAEQVVIVSGSQQALDLLTRLRVGGGDVVAVEDPGYPEARRAFATAGADLLHVPIDDEGLDVAYLARHAGRRPPRLVYVSPSHQFPTGVTLSLGRRLALLEWAGQRDVLIVEDDYDSEFRYSGRPVESLQGLDRWARAVYIGTFSTVLFPPFRVGYVVLPPDLVEPFVKAKWLADRQTPTLEQIALADFLAEGHFGRHLRRMRRLAAERRAVLLAGIKQHLGRLVYPPLASTGMHVLLRLRIAPSVDAAAVENRVAARAADRGVGVYPSAPCYSRQHTQPALLLGYPALPPDRIREGLERLGDVVRKSLAPT